jgi:hypothetical protein
MKSKRRRTREATACETSSMGDQNAPTLPLGPAKLHAGHARRNLGVGAGAKRAWRNDAEHPLTLAYVKGQLIRGNEIYTAKQRYDAGEEYRQLHEAMHRSGRDSTDINLVSGGSGLSISQIMVDSAKKIACIESHLKAQDRAIVRHVCGEGWWPSEAVRAACGNHYDKAVVPRFCEALDNLVDAIAEARRARYAFVPAPAGSQAILPADDECGS